MRIVAGVVAASFLDTAEVAMLPALLIIQLLSDHAARLDLTDKATESVGVILKLARAESSFQNDILSYLHIIPALSHEIVAKPCSVLALDHATLAEPGRNSFLRG